MALNNNDNFEEIHTIFTVGFMSSNPEGNIKHEYLEPKR